MLVLSPTSTAVGLTTAGPASSPGEPDKYYPTDQRTFVRLAPDDAVQAAAQVRLQRRLGCRATYVLNDGEFDGYDRAVSYQLAAPRAPACTVLGAQSFDPAAQDYSSLALHRRPVGGQLRADQRRCPRVTRRSLARQVGAALPRGEAVRDLGAGAAVVHRSRPRWHPAGAGRARVHHRAGAPPGPRRAALTLRSPRASGRRGRTPSTAMRRCGLCSSAIARATDDGKHDGPALRGARRRHGQDDSRRAAGRASGSAPTETTTLRDLRRFRAQRRQPRALVRSRRNGGVEVWLGSRRLRACPTSGPRQYPARCGPRARHQTSEEAYAKSANGHDSVPAGRHRAGTRCVRKQQQQQQYQQQ